ncbi:uncharacterized protein LOC133174023 [Saccostrea echinata]|uniref:uncharacterized protein LOC133174023 n=1 Tax=Saccostrea echinata TaxID=191078 RepID=UPI002A83FA69|nr:uncharacterized protein LOC133174023 [Saccostrea echinata]
MQSVMEVKVPKTPRRPNWTEKEKLVLVEAVRQREDRLFGKMKGSGGVKNVKLKEGAWEKVAEAVNAQSDTVERTVEEVWKQYANIKQRAKEKSDAIRRPVTGGGPKPPSPSPVETEILNHLEDRPTLCGLSSGHDTEEVVLGCLQSTAGDSFSEVLASGDTCLGNSISCTNMEIPINNSTQFGQIIDLQLPSTISTKTSKRRKTMEDEEIKTLKAEREKYIQETIKLKEEAEYYRIKTLFLKKKINEMSQSKRNSEQ